jgi:hypothetical protein
VADAYDVKDALARARAEIDLELNRWKIRLKDKAIAKTQLALAEGQDPVEAGRAAALSALTEDFYSEGGTPALAADNS